jgi:hypothetical protein
MSLISELFIFIGVKVEFSGDSILLKMATVKCQKVGLVPLLTITEARQGSCFG